MPDKSPPCGLSPQQKLLVGIAGKPSTDGCSALNPVAHEARAHRLPRYNAELSVTTLCTFLREFSPPSSQYRRPPPSRWISAVAWP